MKRLENKVEENFLTDLSDPINIYLWGLFWADASMVRGNRLRYECLEEDFLEREDLFRAFGIKSIGRSYRNRGQPTKSFYFSNKKLATFLEAFGFRTKSLKFNEKLFQNIKPELHYHFWRGFFDGDGFVYVKNRGKHSFYSKLNFTCGINFDWTELEKFLTGLDITFYTKRKVGASGSVSFIEIYKKENIQKLLDIMYSDTNSIFLTRKYKKYLQFSTQNLIRLANSSSFPRSDHRNPLIEAV